LNIFISKKLKKNEYFGKLNFEGEKVELRSLAERKRGEREKIIWREGKNYLARGKKLFGEREKIIF